MQHQGCGHVHNEERVGTYEAVVNPSSGIYFLDIVAQPGYDPTCRKKGLYIGSTQKHKQLPINFSDNLENQRQEFCHYFEVLSQIVPEIVLR